MSNIFAIASTYTLDNTLQSVLKQCAVGKYPAQFKVNKGKIVTSKGNIFEISRDPMEVCNLVHDLLHGNDRSPKVVSRQMAIIENSRRSSRSSVKSTASAVGISDDAVYAFAKRETHRLGKDEYHKERLISCIFTAIMLGIVSPVDFTMDGERIISIHGIDTSTPCMENKQ